MWSWVVLALLQQAGAVQSIAVLWAWPHAYVGPRWAKWVMQAAVLAIIVGVVILQVWLLFISCWQIAIAY
jgi:preprotein translocase subunit SecF